MWKAPSSAKSRWVCCSWPNGGAADLATQGSPNVRTWHRYSFETVRPGSWGVSTGYGTVVDQADVSPDSNASKNNRSMLWYTVVTSVSV